jgi:hypothetical protein
MKCFNGWSWIKIHCSPMHPSSRDPLEIFNLWVEACGIWLHQRPLISVMLENIGSLLIKNINKNFF